MKIMVCDKLTRRLSPNVKVALSYHREFQFQVTQRKACQFTKLLRAIRVVCLAKVTSVHKKSALDQRPKCALW